MKFFLISDKIDTLTGMRLAGIDGKFVALQDKELLIKTLDETCQDSSVGIICITENLAQIIPDEIHKIILNKNMPMVTVIPDRHGLKRADDYLTKYIKEAIGVKL